MNAIRDVIKSYTNKSFIFIAYLMSKAVDHGNFCFYLF